MDPGVFFRIHLFSSEYLVKRKQKYGMLKLINAQCFKDFFDQEELPNIFVWGKSWFIFSYVVNDSSPISKGTQGK